MYPQIWTEWKSEIKKKLAHNKVESRATGGGPFNQHQLTQTEESIVRLCGMQTAVEGVSGPAFGVINDDSINAINDDIPTTSHKRAETHTICSTPKRRKTETTAERLNNFLDADVGKKRN